MWVEYNSGLVLLYVLAGKMKKQQIFSQNRIHRFPSVIFSWMHRLPLFASQGAKLPGRGNSTICDNTKAELSNSIGIRIHSSLTTRNGSEDRKGITMLDVMTRRKQRCNGILQHNVEAALLFSPMFSAFVWHSMQPLKLSLYAGIR